MNLIDTNILIDYFEGKLPEKYLELLEYSNISCVTLVELADKFEKTNTPFEEVKEFIEKNFTIINMTFEIASLAAKIKKEKRKTRSKLGLTDAIILATAKINKLKLYTKDEDFEGEARVLKY